MPLLGQHGHAQDQRVHAGEQLATGPQHPCDLRGQVLRHEVPGQGAVLGDDAVRATVRQERQAAGLGHHRGDPARRCAPLRGRRRAGMRGHDPDHRVPGPGRLGRAGRGGAQMSTSSRRPAGSQAASWALATARWNRQYAESEPGRSTASGLAVDVATVDSIRRPTNRRGGRPRRDRRRGPGSAHRAGTTEAIATAAFPGEPLWLILPSLRAASPGWPSCPSGIWFRVVHRRAVMADSPLRIRPAGDLT